MEEFQQTIGDFLDEEGKVLPFKRQLTIHHTIDYDQNLNIKVSIPHFTGEEQLEEVLYQLNEVERVFEFLNLLENRKGEASGYKIEGAGVFLVATSAEDKSPIWKEENLQLG